jgi:hypothetical protein
VLNNPPSLVHYETLDEYRQHFKSIYCKQAIHTFDGLQVRFSNHDFDHCMYESTNRDRVKDQFSVERSQRIDWIKATLENPNAILFEGWLRDEKRYDNARRVALCYNNFVVVILLQKNKRAKFLTAYVANEETIQKLRKSPKIKITAD